MGLLLPEPLAHPPLGKVGCWRHVRGPCLSPPGPRAKQAGFGAAGCWKRSVPSRCEGPFGLRERPNVGRLYPEAAVSSSCPQNAWGGQSGCRCLGIAYVSPVFLDSPFNALDLWMKLSSFDGDGNQLCDGDQASNPAPLEVGCNRKRQSWPLEKGGVVLVAEISLSSGIDLGPVLGLLSNSPALAVGYAWPALAWPFPCFGGGGHPLSCCHPFWDRIRGPAC